MSQTAVWQQAGCEAACLRLLKATFTAALQDRQPALALALALAHSAFILRQWPPVQELATFTASCEKYVGTESGGMDQAISIMGQKGIAKLVEFNPVQPWLAFLLHAILHDKHREGSLACSKHTCLCCYTCSNEPHSASHALITASLCAGEGCRRGAASGRDFRDRQLADGFCQG